MDALGSITILTLSLLAAFSPFLSFSYVAAKTKAFIAKEREGMLGDIITLKQERARAAGTIGSAVRAGTMKRVEEDDGEEEETAIHPMLAGLAQQLGIDPAKVMAGDSAELAKVQAALQQFKGAQPAAPVVYL